MATHRIVFELDEGCHHVLEDVRRKLGVATKGEALSACLYLVTALQSQASAGFTDILVREPGGDELRRLTGFRILKEESR
jgi:hypothetical protein